MNYLNAFWVGGRKQEREMKREYWVTEMKKWGIENANL